MPFSFIVWLLVSLFCAVPILVQAEELARSKIKVAAEVVHCHDGDTCTVVVASGLSFNVRLAGIDAPEVGRFGMPSAEGQPLGLASRDALISLAVNKKNTLLRQIDLDRYNRPVMEIFVAGELINVKMLEIGMAERYTGNTKGLDSSKYEIAETKSKNGKVGIWSNPHYVSPKNWRHEVKK
jgi:micrococcal nuclease